MRRICPSAAFVVLFTTALAGSAKGSEGASRDPASVSEAGSSGEAAPVPPPGGSGTPVPPPGGPAATVVPAGAAAPEATVDRPTAPDIAFNDMSGAPHRLSEFRGHPVILEFWASWCVPCRKGFPYYDDLAARYEPTGLKIVAVTLEEDSAAVESFVAKYPVRFLVGRDPSGAAGEEFEVAAMPTSILIDAEGHPLARFEGGTDDVHRDMEAAIDAYLRGEPVQVGRDAPARNARGTVRAWQRGYLADPIMSLDGDPLTRIQREHVHGSKEGAAGDGGVAGGGCGCN